ncbi:alkane 1-monooxygenase [Flavobacterium xanthum]|uniref:Alkane 1-monooxygenase n=1 Tax=Flavobacterium xanthum TaxID=69322 RepID=A0A1M7FPK0_9FLAO|nr:alkane 1-monooxygenase [Flavobacterium xanthum]SHM05619.1 alkane 1-monooxygenase [Flavobacterium xanthum]
MKYLFAYSIPVIGMIGIYFGGFWTYAALLFAFVMIPLLELILPIDEKNYDTETISKRLHNKFFDVLLLLNVPIVYGAILFSLYRITQNQLPIYEIIGMTLSLGIILGANGINVAHELGHRNTMFEKIMGKILLIPSHYTHFFIEHNHGHHLHVSTPEDPSTAKFNQSLYSFWFQTVTGTYSKAWQIQKKLNKIENRSLLSIKNDMFWFTVIQVTYLLTIYYFFGFTGLFFAIFSGIVGFLLLETINYIEHYGLKRNQLASGRYERVTEKHSWNSNHVLGRIILYELTRHSDHHFKSQKKYQILEYHDVSPQMPYGYPTSMVLSFFPPLWFAVMNKRIPVNMK